MLDVWWCLVAKHFPFGRFHWCVSFIIRNIGYPDDLAQTFSKQKALIIIMFLSVRNIRIYTPTNIFARARLVKTRHVSEYSPAKTGEYPEIIYSEQIMSVDKYPSIFSRQMEAIVYILAHAWRQEAIVLKENGGKCERWRRKPLNRSGGMLPKKILKSRGLEMLFPAFSKSYLWFTHIANSLLRTLSQQTNVNWEYSTCNVNYKIESRLSLYLETSKSFTSESS